MLIQIYEYMFKFPQGAFNVFLRVQCANNVITHYLADTIEYFFVLRLMIAVAFLRVLVTTEVSLLRGWQRTLG